MRFEGLSLKTTIKSVSQPHTLVCLDGNFEQKRYENSARDFPSCYPHDCFLTPEELRAADVEVNACRKRAAPSQPKSSKMEETLREALKPDEMEPNLPLPVSAYEGCERSYVAADEQNHKTTTGAFAVTGLMGLVCRHDRVIFLANITSAGEKQSYAIALLQKLFNGLPVDWTLGVLYDIACQLDRSMKKVGVISVFANTLL